MTNNTDTTAGRKLRAVCLAFIMMGSVLGATVAFSGMAAAVGGSDTSIGNSGTSTGDVTDIPGGSADETQDLSSGGTTANDIVIKQLESNNQHAIRIDVSDLENAGVDISDVEVASATARAGSIDFTNFDAQDSEIQLVATDDNSNVIAISDLQLSGLDTSNVNSATGLTYDFRVDDKNSGDFSDAGFTTDALLELNTFSISSIPVVNLDTGDETTETSLTKAIAEANGGDGDLPVASGETVEIRLGNGTFQTTNHEFTNNPVNIVAQDGTDPIIQSQGNDAKLLEVTNSNADLTVEGVDFDLAGEGTTTTAIDVTGVSADLTVSDSSFDNIAGSDDYINVDEDAETVEITGTTFEDSNDNNPTHILVSDTGGTNLDLTITGSTLNGSNIGLDVSNTPSDLSDLTVDNNEFNNNNEHIRGDKNNANPGLDSIFTQNTFDQFVITRTSGTIVSSSSYAIFGDFVDVDTSDVDTQDATTTISAGDHTDPTGLTITSTGVTITSPQGESPTIAADSDPVISHEPGSDNAADDLEVSGLTFDLSGQGSAIASASGATDDVINSVTIDSNEFLNADSSSIAVDYTSNTPSSLEGVDISDNTFDSSSDYVAIDLTGLATSSSNDEVVQVRNNEINDADDDAIDIADPSDGNLDISIENNVITNHSDTTNNDGIAIDAALSASGDSLTIENNEISSDGSEGTDSAATAIQVSGTAGGSIAVEDNSIVGFDDGSGSGTAIDAQSAGISIQSNTLTDNAIAFNDGGDNFDESALISGNTLENVVVVRSQEGGSIQNNEVYQTVEGGVTNAGGNFVDVGAGTYEESGISITGGVTIDGTDGAGATTITTDASASIFDINSNPGAEVTISDLTLAPQADNANADILLSGADSDVTIANMTFSGPGTQVRDGVLVGTTQNNNDLTVRIENSEFSNYAAGVQFDDTGGTNDAIGLEIIRNTFTENANGVSITSQDGSADEIFRIHLNDFVDNEAGLNNDVGDANTAEFDSGANYWGSSDGPSADSSLKTFAGTGAGDAITGTNIGSVAVTPWLEEPVDTLPTDEYIVVTDPRDRVASPTGGVRDDAAIIVAAPTDNLASNSDSSSTTLLANNSGPLNNLGSATRGNLDTAADVLHYYPDGYTSGVNSDTPGVFTFEAADTDGNIPRGTAVQTFVGEPTGVEVVTESDTLVADGDSTVNVTLTVVDDQGNSVQPDSGNDDVSFIIDNGSAAGTTRVTEEDQTNNNLPNSEARLELSADTAGPELSVTGVFDADGFQDTVSIDTVEPAQTNFSVEFVDGPTTIIQNESYSATVNVTNEGDSAGTQDITYDLEDSIGVSQLSATEEDVQLDAGASEEVTFEVAASDTQSLSTGNFTHVFSSDDDEITLDAEVVEETAEQSPIDGPAAEFDADADGDISITELGDAGTAFAQGELTIAELGAVGQEFAS